MSAYIHRCAYCDEPTVLVDGRTLYPYLGDNLLDKRFFLCRPCDAWVGCHPGTTTALGRTAKADLRRAKSEAHAAFDPLWQSDALRNGTSKGFARRAAYDWLASALGMTREDCHIGMMDVATCYRVISLVRAHLKGQS